MDNVTMSARDRVLFFVVVLNCNYKSEKKRVSNGLWRHTLLTNKTYFSFQ